MHSDINKVFLLGWVAGEPVLQYDQQRYPKANVILETRKSVVSKTAGSNLVVTDEYPLVFEGSAAEILGEHVHDGEMIHVVGQLRSRRIRDHSGNSCLVAEVLVTDIRVINLMQRQRAAAQKVRHTKGRGLDAMPLLPADDPIFKAGAVVGLTFGGPAPRATKSRGSKRKKGA